MSLNFTAGQRLMVIAPHPDDESLATGGLIMSAIEAEAEVRILFATNGDNNPWPQRWVEKRWRIGIDERRRWGGARRHEAKAAVKALGLPVTAAHFLNLPDQGTTDRLLTADKETLDLLCRELEAWRPDVLVLPSPHDLHPDHNALYILFQIAKHRLGLTGLPQWEFIVHCKRPDLVIGRQEIPISEALRQRKITAILQHRTQMVLSEKRFVAYARPSEAYFEPTLPAEELPWHHIQKAVVKEGQLHLTVRIPPFRIKPVSLYIVGETTSCESLRWRFPLPRKSGPFTLFNAIDGTFAGEGIASVQDRISQISIPLSVPLAQLFVKLHRRIIFLDTAGWRPVPLPAL